MTSTLFLAAILATVPIDQSWLQSHGPAPYLLGQAGSYQLQTDVSTAGAAFKITANGVALDLGGHVVTYDAADPIVVLNSGFETGDTSGWNVTQAPAAVVAPAMLGMYGNRMLNFPSITVPQTVVSSPITIPQAGIPYLAGITAKAITWGTATTTLSVIDTVTGATLGTPQKLDPGGGPILIVTFTPTIVNPVVLKIDILPTSGKTATVCLDYACLDRNSVYGIDLSYKTATITNGTVTQGPACSAQSPPIFAYGANLTLNGVTASATGMSTNIVYCNWSNGVSVTNCSLIGRLDRMVNRMAANAEIYALASQGVVDIENNHLTGTHQNGIVVAGGNRASSFNGIVIKNNDIRLNSSWTNGYGIGLGGWCRNFEIAHNAIIPISGRGIMLDTGNNLITGGTIHDNDVEIQERGDLEYGQMGLCATALRMRNWEGTISNLDVYNNTFAAQTGIGPGIPAHADFAAAGARLGLYNDIGQENNCNITFRNNLFRAIVVKSDPSITYNIAWGLSFPRYDAGMGVKFIGNTCESNNNAVNFGDSDGINESDITMIGTTVVKSADGQPMPFSSFMVGGWGSTVRNVRCFDTVFTNGASSIPTFIGLGAKDISFGSSVSLKTVNANGGPIGGLPLQVKDGSGALVSSPVTDTSGSAMIQLVTQTYSVLAKGNNATPVVVTAPPYSVCVSVSGSATANLAVSSTVSLVVQ